MIARGAIFILTAITALAPIAAATGESGTGVIGADGVIANLQGVYEGVDDLKASFVQKTTSRALRKTFTERGKLYFRKPSRMLWDYAEPDGKKIIMDGGFLWMVVPGEPHIYRQEITKAFETSTPLAFLTGVGRLTDEFRITAAPAEGGSGEEPVYRLTLDPKAKDSPIRPMDLLVDRSSFLVIAVESTDLLGNHTEIRFSGIEIDVGLTEDLFVYTPPPDIRVVEPPARIR